MLLPRTVGEGATPMKRAALWTSTAKSERATTLCRYGNYPRLERWAGV